MLVSVWFPIHFLTAGLTWGLRELIYAEDSLCNAERKNLDDAVDSGRSDNTGPSASQNAPADDPAHSGTDSADDR